MKYSYQDIELRIAGQVIDLENWTTITIDMHFEREVDHAMSNLQQVDARHTLHSPAVILEATQRLRALDPNWGSKFRKDPRPFSSLPRRATAEQVATFIEKQA